MKIWLPTLALIIFLLSSCSVLLRSKTMVVIPSSYSTIKPDTTWYTIKQATIKNNTLTLEIAYVGNKKTTFELIGSQAISKSIPPQRSIQLIQNNHSELATKTFHVKLKTDITKFAYINNVNNLTVLNLFGYNNLYYTYKID